MSNEVRDCPFCHPEGVLFGNALAFVTQDKFPVNPGHLLIVPRRHIADFFQTTEEEKNAMWSLLDKAKKYLDEKHTPAGYNVGINVGEVAGQTVMHVHLHLIPRYPGDLENPRGGVRGVIPSRQSY